MQMIDFTVEVFKRGKSGGWKPTMYSHCAKDIAEKMLKEYSAMYPKRKFRLVKNVYDIEEKREWKAVGKQAILFVNGVHSRYSEEFATHAAAKSGAERLNEEDAE